MLALLYDVHGNLSALEAVLADARGEGATGHLLGGDFTLFGPQPAATLARLRELEDALWLRGNGERWTASPQEAPAPVRAAIDACREQLAPAEVESLAQLPQLLELGDAIACHGSPVSDVRSFSPEPGGDETELLAGIETPRLIFGHTHLPFVRRVQVSEHAPGGVELVNPGSVGMPFDGDPRASYALLHPDGAVEHRRVRYDHRAAAAALRERFDGEWTALVAARIEQARFDATV